MNASNQQVVLDVAASLLGTLNPQTQKEAEKRLTAFESAVPDFPHLLLQLTGPDYVCRLSLPAHVNVPAVLLLKNLIKRNWADVNSSVLSANVRQAIKNDIFSSLSQASASVRTQLGEVICAIALHDFPENWPELVDRLLERIAPADFAANLAVLKTLHHIFKRYRLEERSNELYSEINFVMSKFGPALLQIFVGIEGILRSGEQDRQLVALVIQNATCASKIFFSLTFQDIPAFVEDNLSEFMRILLFLYGHQNPALQSSGGDEPGVLEKLASSVAKIVILFASKYEDDFTMLGDFAQATWGILTARVSLLPRDDKLTCTCMEFLSSVARKERHQAIFQHTLPVICDKVIVPNMQIRDSDLEVFEEEPIEFIRRDADGVGEISHRHGAAVALVRGLMEFYEAEVTQILLALVQRSLSEYATDANLHWRAKLLAIQVFSALGARGYTEMFGVTQVNAHVNLGEFFHAHVKSDLQSDGERHNPLLRLEAIKFVTNYRSQLSKRELMECLSLLMHHLESKNYIVHTYAAMAIEKILSVRRGGEHGFQTADVAAIAGRLCINILALIFNHKSVEKMCENYFLVKALMRVLALAQPADVDNLCRAFLDRMAWLLSEIVKNPMSPLFDHYFFESLAIMIKSAGAAKVETFQLLESKIVPLLFSILQSEQSDLFPYAFQLLVVFVECGPVRGLSEYVRTLLPMVIQPPLWSVSCNIPALVRFLQACFVKDPAWFSTSQVVESILTLFRMLVNSRVNDIYGFALVNALNAILPAELMTQYTRPALLLILSRIQSHKSWKISSCTLLFLCNIIVESNIPSPTTFLLQTLEQIQPRIYMMLFRSLFLSVIPKIQESGDRKLMIVGLSSMLVALEHHLRGGPEDVSFWLDVLAEVIKAAAHARREEASVADMTEDISTAQGSFNRLVSVPKFRRYVKLDSYPDAELHMLRQLQSLTRSGSSGLTALLASRLDETSRGQLASLLQRHNISL